jgi:DNA polymerase/3'-5' exonuclease PolX
MSENKAEEKALRDLERAEADLKRGDLKHATEEAREAVEELEKAEHDDLVPIIVDDVEYKVRRGKWLVRDLKAKLGIDPAKVLAEITPHGVKDLDDNQEIEVHAHEKFMTHARSGGSS